MGRRDIIGALSSSVRRGLHSYNLKNYPFICGEKFSWESDLSFESQPENWRVGSKEFSDAKVVFVKGDHLLLFLEKYVKKLSGKTVIVGNSDEEFGFEVYEGLKNAKQSFVQNLIVPASSNISVLPIGLENPSIGRNGSVSLFQSENLPWAEKKNGVFMGYVSATHRQRLEYLKVAEHLDSSRDIRINSSLVCKRLPPKEFGRKSASHKVIAAPRGNGIDTHRFWETLYRGSIPMVLKSDWSANISGLGFPMITIDSWTVGDVLGSLRLLDQYPSLPDPPLLWWKNWECIIKE